MTMLGKLPAHWSGMQSHPTLILNSSWELMVYIISVLSILRAPSLHRRTSCKAERAEQGHGLEPQHHLCSLGRHLWGTEPQQGRPAHRGACRVTVSRAAPLPAPLTPEIPQGAVILQENKAPAQAGPLLSSAPNTAPPPPSWIHFPHTDPEPPRYHPVWDLLPSRNQ